MSGEFAIKTKTKTAESMVITHEVTAAVGPLFCAVILQPSMTEEVLGFSQCLNGREEEISGETQVQ